jgi:K+-sensing histidine kinase KdpD
VSSRDASSKATSPQLLEPADLVFAVCHEIGNLVTAVQLEADLLDEGESAVGLAASAVKIEDLCAQVGGLLAQVRPLLSDTPGTVQPGIDAEVIVAAVEAQLEWRGSGHTVVSSEVEARLPRLEVDPDSVRDLLLALVSAALERRPACKQLAISARAKEGGVAFRAVDDGPPEEALENFASAARCGRPLVCSVAENLLRRVGGRVEARRSDGATTVEFWLPGSAGA